MARADGQRPVTRAHRGFSADELRQLEREDLRKLCHGLLLADAADVNDYRPTAEMDEFTVNVPSLWHMHRVLMRIYHRPICNEDLDDARAFAATTGAIEALVLAAHGITEATSLVGPGLTIMSAEEFVERITSSALVRWDADQPSLAIDRLDLMLHLSRTALVDPVGIEWLPSLALNELPPALTEYGIEPQDLLERKTFRLLTATFRFGGYRYGEAFRGKRLPDAVLHWPDGSPTSALLDCKAASSGYRMDADHLLRFINYWDTLAPQLDEDGRDLRYLIVLSSFFPGQQGDRHPYWNRAEEIEDKTGLHLAYITASDLAWAAARLESSDAPLQARQEIDWNGVLGSGLVKAGDLDAAVSEVLP